MQHDGFLKDSGKRSFHPAENYDGIKESVVTVDVDGEMVQASPVKSGDIAFNKHPNVIFGGHSIYQSP